MLEWLAASQIFWFAGLPYLSLGICVAGYLHLRRHRPERLVLPSTQPFETRLHFWMSIPLHYGIGFVLLIHLLAFVAPGFLLWWNRSVARRFSLELAMLTAGFLALVGLVAAWRRRQSVAGLRAVTTRADRLLLGALMWQVVTGILIAILHPWGTGWLAAAGAPYVRSLAILAPDWNVVSAAPLLLRLHVAGAFFLIALIPFTRLIHVLFIPLSYLWRAPIVIRRRRGDVAWD
ncbi:MAG: respiratory nitrate reductase subunit gamma [Acidobacteriota bacterium]